MKEAEDHCIICLLNAEVDPKDPEATFELGTMAGWTVARTSVLLAGEKIIDSASMCTKHEMTIAAMGAIVEVALRRGQA